MTDPEDDFTQSQMNQLNQLNNDIDIPNITPETTSQFRAQLERILNAHNNQQLQTTSQQDNTMGIGDVTPTIASDLSDLSGFTLEQIIKQQKNLIKVCNNVVEPDNEKDSAMISIVKTCVKDDVWPDTKFLTDNCIKNQNFDDDDNGFKNSVVGKLLKKTRQLHLVLDKRVAFWGTYSGIVKDELNKLKMTKTRTIKDAIFKGKSK